MIDVSPGPQVLKKLQQAFGYSVLTQVVSSGSNLILSVMLIRFLSIDGFGSYTYIFLFASFASAVTASLTGGVYTYCVQKMSRLRQSYDKNYNGMNCIVLSGVSGIAALAYFSLPQSGTIPGPVSAVLFILTFATIDNMKLQASANNLHRWILAVECSRQTVTIGTIVLVGWWGGLSLSAVLATMSVTAVVSVAALMVKMHWQVRFDRLDWVFQRHWVYARHLMPATIISTIHTSGLQMVALWQFGAGSVGLLRTAELPFSALNSVRLGMPLIMPRWMNHFESERLQARSTGILKKVLLYCLVSFVTVLVVYGAGAVLLPILTGKSYPLGIGIIYAAAHFFFLLQAVNQIYLNVIGKSASNFSQSILGATVAMAVYIPTSYVLGVAASPIAGTAAVAAMTSLGVSDILRHMKANPGRWTPKGREALRADDPTEAVRNI